MDFVLDYILEVRELFAGSFTMSGLTMKPPMQHESNCQIAVANDRDINQLCEVRWFTGHSLSWLLIAFPYRNMGVRFRKTSLHSWRLSSHLSK